MDFEKEHHRMVAMSEKDYNAFGEVLMTARRERDLARAELAASKTTIDNMATDLVSYEESIRNLKKDNDDWQERCRQRDAALNHQAGTIRSLKSQLTDCRKLNSQLGEANARQTHMLNKVSAPKPLTPTEMREVLGVMPQAPEDMSDQASGLVPDLVDEYVTFPAPADRPRTEKGLTFGEKLIRTDFNPSGSPAVDTVKHALAEAIDTVRAFRDEPFSFPTRVQGIATAKIEDAAMWAVKAITEEK